MPKTTSKRTKRGRKVVPTPLVRRSEIAPSPAGLSFAREGGLLDLLAARLVADERHRAAPSAEAREALSAARGAVNDAVDYQRRVKGRRTEVAAFLGALASDGGAMLATYAHAHEDYRGPIRREVLAWAEVIERRRIDDPSTIEMLARAHLGAGESAALRGRAFRLPIDHPEAAALREEARKAGNASRLDTIAGLALASEARDAAPDVDPLVLIEQLAEEREREAIEHPDGAEDLPEDRRAGEASEGPGGRRADD